MLNVRNVLQRHRFVLLGVLLAILLPTGFLLFASSTNAQVPSGNAGGLAASSVKPAYAAYAPMDTDTPTPTNTPISCAPAWSVVSSPHPGASALSDVEVVTANDVWAVGSYDPGPGSRTLTLHWDGTSWTQITSPNVNNHGYLYGVAAVSANDVWAVGNGNSPSQTLVEHWDGTSWSVVPSPNVGTNSNRLNGVAAVSATDVWAVGYYDNGSGPYHTFVEHWDGTSWSVVPNPNPGASGNFLYGITAVSANDVWAVGSAGSQTLVEHWDGTLWSVVPSPNPSVYGNALNAVAAVSATDVWAVGYYCINSCGSIYQTLTEHWDGTSWSVVPSPDLGTGQIGLYGVAAVSATDVWAVGEYFTGIWRTLIGHWDGTSWSVVSSPSPGGVNYLNGIAAVSANDVWAVGYNSNPGSGVNQTLVEHYATLCGTPTNTPTITPTNTPTNTRTITPTITPGGPTLTPTITGTPPTDTPTPSAPAIINGHLTWQDVSAANRPSVTGTLQLCVSGSTQTFNFTTNTSGNFTVTAFLYDGTYHWWTKGGRHISNSSPADGSDLVISGGQATKEFGIQKGSDAIADNIANALDFNQLKNQFGQAGVRSADYDYNRVVNASDFSITKHNFGMAGHGLTCP